ncbi:MAG: OmpA family protein [Candidatus Binatia bacterium]
MKASQVVAVLLIGGTLLSGCEYGRRYVSKPWGAGTYIPAVVCTAVGAGVGVLIQNQRSGTSTATIINPDGTRNTVSASDNKNLWEGAAIGAPIGAALCGLLGHAIFDAETAPSTQPPPPPPPPSLAPTPVTEGLPPPLSGKRIVLRAVSFDFNRSGIRPESRPVLDEAAELLRGDPSVRVSVEGHCDAIGSDTRNQALSVERAEAVFRFLVNHGISPERMAVVGYGSTRPVAGNETEGGRTQNRRVELRVVSQQQESDK